MSARSIGILAVVGASLSVCQVAQATPFTLEYSITDLGSFGYQYDFELIFDNNDGTWISGQEFDRITFGDVPYLSGGNGAFGQWSWLTVPTGFTGASSSGGHNGPTLCYGANCALPGYVPSSLGETIAFSGLGQNYLGDGQLLWSNLVGTSGIAYADFETAALVPSPVPIPAALPLFATALAGALGFSLFRRRRGGANRPAGAPA